jgi:hypothetical protein
VASDQVETGSFARRRAAFRTALAVAGATLAAAFLAIPAAADCPTYAADAAVRARQVSEGTQGEVSALFASADRSALPADACAEVAYDFDVGVNGLVRRLATPPLTSDSLSVAIDSPDGAGIGFGATAVHRRTAAGADELEVSQRIAAAGSELAGSWLRTEAVDRVNASVADTQWLGGARKLTLRNGIGFERDRTGQGFRWTNLAASVRFEMPGFGISTERSGSGTTGWHDSLQIDMQLSGRLAARRITGGTFRIERNSAAPDRYAGNIGMSLLGADIRLGGSLTRSRDWTVEIDWTLFDTVAGSVALSADLGQAAESANGTFGLTGNLNW